MPVSARRPLGWLVVFSVGLVLSVAFAAEAPADEPPRVVAVGDIACQTLTPSSGEGACRSDEVADLITELDPDRFLALGDLQYSKGTAREFARVWDVQFGHLNDIVAPIPGNHEYDTPGAAGYYGYFGAKANAELGYYSFDLGSWHVVALNSAICDDDPGCGPGSPQYVWLAADLAANSDSICTLALQHNPPHDWRPYQKWVVDDGTTRNGGSETEPYRELFGLMDGAGVDVILVADNHLYQRWAPVDVDGNVTAGGIRQFTVGTGGRSLYPFGTGPRPAGLEATQNKAFGVLEMTLHPAGYDYRWVGLPGDPEFVDAGSGACM